MAQDEEIIHLQTTKIKHLVKLDLASWAGKHEHTVEEAVCSKNSNKIAQNIGKMLTPGKASRKHGVFHMTKADGTKSTSSYEDRVVFRDYFAGVFAAQLMSFEGAICSDRNCRYEEACDRELPEIDDSIMPCFYEIACGFAHRKTKAPGEDCRGGEVYREYPEELAEAYLPLDLKAKALCDHPITFKGGQLHPLLKGDGDPCIASNSRDILLADDSGKSLQSNYRPALNNVVSQSTLSTQWGSGLHGGATGLFTCMLMLVPT